MLAVAAIGMAANTATGIPGRDVGDPARENGSVDEEDGGHCHSRTPIGSHCLARSTPAPREPVRSLVEPNLE